jgi:hypothetical protein
MRIVRKKFIALHMSMMSPLWSSQAFQDVTQLNRLPVQLFMMFLWHASDTITIHASFQELPEHASDLGKSSTKKVRVSPQKLGHALKTRRTQAARKGLLQFPLQCQRQKVLSQALLLKAALRLHILRYVRLRTHSEAFSILLKASQSASRSMVWMGCLGITDVSS